MKRQTAILVLEDGTIFKAWSTLPSCTLMGEVVFTTSITGYQEVLTDPSYSGQIVVFTYPEIGNTGINKEDNESLRIQCRAIILRNLCNFPSNWRLEQSLFDFAQKQGVPILYGLDTRQLTQHLRKVGAMNACISSETLTANALLPKLKKTASMQGLDLVQRVTAPQTYKWQDSNLNLNWYRQNSSSEKYSIVLIDYGVKYNILNYLSSYGYDVIVVPAMSTAEEILSYQPSGIMLSNGPGDPFAVTYAVEVIKDLLNTKIPIFGICMGHQILCLALGAQTFKLKFGHRGINHPTGIFQKVEITSQNHGFAVNAASEFTEKVRITHYNLNDYTVAGIAHKTLPVFSVQYHPEASPGPHDADYFFDAFLKVVKSAHENSTD
uniref:carbamoyl-phosphate synthase arginine-specific small subunit n=1 Tax=Tsunamia transpacifica TaxID=1935457 RepID=UPI001BEFEF70|nr:carbamoyl-phosphate synthase arginine-specific small subunit [Tsunamia transpacifica]QUE27834.1 CarA [Tsunamia transpacifica]UNJ14349.1 carbamoyl-phosphate synthase arginine-specific small subunit [Tsunamia transpacifica]